MLNIAMTDKNALKMADYICDTITNFYYKQKLCYRHFMSGSSLIETIFGSWHGTLGYLEKATIMSEWNIRNELFYGGSRLVPLRVYDYSSRPIGSFCLLSAKMIFR